VISWTTAAVAALALAVGVGLSAVVGRRLAARSTDDATAEWRRCRSSLEPAQRRAVLLAVRQGRPVDDRALRPAAQLCARAMLAAATRLQVRGRSRRWLQAALVLTTLAAAVALAVDDRKWPHVLTLAMNAVLLAVFAFGRRLAQGLVTRAEAGLAANQAPPGRIDA